MSDASHARITRKFHEVAMSNENLLGRSRAAVWHPCTQMKQHEHLPLIPISHGKGVWLYDFEGKAYLDAISSWWVNLFGHANPRINAALKDQLEKLEQVMLAGFTHAPVIELSERLSQLAPGNLGHCFYASDGASAIEIALKMSFHFWRNSGQAQKTGFVSVANGYHGETLGALSVTDVALFKDTYAPLLRQSHQVPSPDWRLAAPGESAENYALRCAESLAHYLEQHHATTAALIVEPLVQCAGGMAMHHPLYLQRVREICDQFQVHLIADEIAVGFGRTGTLFACEQAAIAPDFLCLSKGLTGGYLPLSVVLTSDTIYNAFYHDDVARGFLHSHSYTGNPLACRAALATLDIFEQDDVINTNREQATRFTQAMQPLREHPRIRHFRHLGMIWAFDIVDGAPDFSVRFYHAALQRGLVLRPLGNTVYFMPPYVIEDAEVESLVENTLHCLAAI
jgi:adenosylmethionine-8-amino-7-oxononanoate aminotransferase